MSPWTELSIGIVQPAPVGLAPAVSAGCVVPMAAQIARQAGCSVRSIFERFSDLNALSLATGDYAIAQGQAEAVTRSVDGDRPTRIQSMSRPRASLRKVGPQWRIITNLDELVELRSRIVMVRLANTERMKLMYGPELSRLSERARVQLPIALAVLISFESWDQMRHWYDLSMEAAKALGGLRSTGCGRRLDNRCPFHKLENQLGRPV